MSDTSSNKFSSECLPSLAEDGSEDAHECFSETSSEGEPPLGTHKEVLERPAIGSLGVRTPAYLRILLTEPGECRELTVLVARESEHRAWVGLLNGTAPGEKLKVSVPANCEGTVLPSPFEGNVEILESSPARIIAPGAFYVRRATPESEIQGGENEVKFRFSSPAGPVVEETCILSDPGPRSLEADVWAVTRLALSEMFEGEDGEVHVETGVYSLGLVSVHTEEEVVMQGINMGVKKVLTRGAGAKCVSGQTIVVEVDENEEETTVLGTAKIGEKEEATCIDMRVGESCLLRIPDKNIRLRVLSCGVPPDVADWENPLSALRLADGISRTAKAAFTRKAYVLALDSFANVATNLTAVIYESGETEEQQKSCHSALTTAQANASLCAIKLGLWPRALNHANEALQQDPSHVKAHYRRAFSHLEGGDPLFAQEDLLRCKSLGQWNREMGVLWRRCVQTLADDKKRNDALLRRMSRDFTNIAPSLA